MEGKDPAKVIRDAIAKTLVFYYPFAGRLKEGPNGKLNVDCTGEGVLFIEGMLMLPSSNLVTILFHHFHAWMSFSSMLKVMFPILKSTFSTSDTIEVWWFHLYYSPQPHHGQCHRVVTVHESLKRNSPRHLLNAQTPPRVTYAQHEFDEEFMDMNDDEIIQPNNMMNLFVFFGYNEISALRKLIPPHYQCTTHDILTACLWRCHTKALQPDPNQHIRLICVVNARSKFNPPLPLGYYRNAIAYPTTVTTPDKLCRSSLKYAI
ncbi:benzyl alcohol O-benzoyltransferase-like isoform X2 [Gossypium australe]|uniref:Benzyl alcohol O-benzoyltransferase-like isoform X2 n=1 Tax=Gossypium australe TaxID=47621 RepID=A0A5B6VV81_9ROSI|nr:benzyl alcohol O-benzoyltransferase-like isoform X2 [Gossypium australe]